MPHHLFADHTDTICNIDHKKGVAHVESAHNHCELFNTNTTLYNHPQIIFFPYKALSTEFQYKIGAENPYYYSTLKTFPARAHPAQLI